MDPEKETNTNLDDIIQIEAEDSVSVDDFIKQLEENLHIVPDSVIEVDESEYDDESLALEPLFKTAAAVAKPEPTEPVKAERRTVPDERVASEIVELRDKISKMESARTELLLDSQRRLKDFEAYRKRTERERRETFVNQVGNLATQMLPALDNLNRALDFASESAAEKPSDFQQFFDGIVMVNQQVNDVFAGMGIVPIAAVGRAFDPHLHEAVAIDESGDFPPNTISAELLRGYRIGEKIIRHSMVKVTRPSAQSEPLPQTDEPAEEPATENIEPVEEPSLEVFADQPSTAAEEDTKDFVFEASNGEVIDPNGEASK